MSLSLTWKINKKKMVSGQHLFHHPEMNEWMNIIDLIQLNCSSILEEWSKKVLIGAFVKIDML